MTTVAQMAEDELREMIESIIEQKLLELVGNPDEGLPIRETIRDRLLRQKESVASGERGEAFSGIASPLETTSKVPSTLRHRPADRVSFMSLSKTEYSFITVQQ